MRAFSERQQLPLAVICFMGDDINDIAAQKIAGLSAAPANAHPAVLATATFIAKNNGGNGAVRELIDVILAARAS